MKKISIVVPMYNEEEMIPLFFETANNVIKNLDNKYKVSFTCVDDGSKDRTLDLLKKQRKIQSNIRIISFSRNFGHEAAVCAGLKQSNGDIIIVMDADLQIHQKLFFN
ncbi:MAG: glycosyltransferase [Bacilli bacterium]